jgi:hypothetical protein
MFAVPPEEVVHAPLGTADVGVVRYPELPGVSDMRYGVGDGAAPETPMVNTPPVPPPSIAERVHVPVPHDIDPVTPVKYPRTSGSPVPPVDIEVPIEAGPDVVIDVSDPDNVPPLMVDDRQLGDTKFAQSTAIERAPVPVVFITMPEPSVAQF